MSPTAGRAFWRSLSVAARHHALLLAISCSYAAVVYGLELVLGAGRMASQVFFQPSFVLFWGVAVYVAAAVLTFYRWQVHDAAGRRVQGRAGWRIAWQVARQKDFSFERPASLAVVALSLPLLINAFGSWKASIPHLRPFAWDERLMALDRLVHLGHDPWRLLQPIFGHPVITHGLDFLYYMWLPVNVGMVIWQAWTTDRAARFRFFVSYALVWIVLGSVIPTVLPAAGPCYFAALVHGVGPYDDLMAYLHAVDAQRPLTAVLVQGMLWREYLAGSATPYTGISAMPSIHVAMPALFALSLWRPSPRMAVVLTGYAVAILLGSILLGWHYAIDGYLSLIGVGCLWLAAGWLSARMHGDASASPQEPAHDEHPLDDHGRPERVPPGDSDAPLRNGDEGAADGAAHRPDRH